MVRLLAQVFLLCKAVRGKMAKRRDCDGSSRGRMHRLRWRSYAVWGGIHVMWDKGLRVTHAFDAL